MIRRRFFLGSLGAAIALKPPALPAQSTVLYQPARHSEDDWLEKLPGKHRMVFDTTDPAGFGGALLFSNNFLEANKSSYGLDYSDMAVVLIARHNSTAFAFNNAIWAKYGSVLAQRLNFNDPKTKQPPDSNLFNAAGYGGALPSLGITLDSLIKRGVHFAVCRMATRALAGAIASATGGQTAAVNDELIANTIANAHMVPAGIVTVSRAQERGYTFALSV